MGEASISTEKPVASPARGRLCVLMTCFNRREITLRCLEAFERDQGLAQLAGVMVDDGSRDGTAEAVRERFPWMQVEVNTGEPLFWCRGMHRALQIALTRGYDNYLLLNDDTVLEPGAITGMLSCAESLRRSEGHPVLVCGSTRDALSGLWTYGGERQRSRWRPVNPVPVPPGDVPQRLDTFNGNVVLLPVDVVERLGNLDPVFEHAMGDTDYGLRATRAGVGVWLAPGYQGQCSVNAVAGTFRDLALSPRQRWRLMLGRKGLPWRSWAHFTRRHAGILWPAYFVWPYLRLLSTMAAQRIRGRNGPAGRA
ncbi:MAG: glycosyltransferase family 2 protein [Paucibacter sp.]|nr:glycosyltransferase family 2 protein [Roseateles sp.]